MYYWHRWVENFTFNSNRYPVQLVTMNEQNINIVSYIIIINYYERKWCFTNTCKFLWVNSNKGIQMSTRILSNVYFQNLNANIRY